MNKPAYENYVRKNPDLKKAIIEKYLKKPDVNLKVPVKFSPDPDGDVKYRPS